MIFLKLLTFFINTIQHWPGYSYLLTKIGIRLHSEIDFIYKDLINHENH